MFIQNNRDLGIAIIQARKDKGWTQQKLADVLFVSRSWVIKAEKGERHLDSTLLINALIALDQRIQIVPDDREEDPYFLALFADHDQL